jgi:hypothetical protein
MLDEFAKKMAVLLMDNYTSQFISDMIRLLTERRVRVTIFASSTAEIFYIFRVTLFGVLKWHPRCEFPFAGETMTVKFRMKVYHNFKQTMVDAN